MAVSPHGGQPAWRLITNQLTTVGQVEREKRECAELLTLSAGDMTSLDDDVRRLTDDNVELRRQLRAMDGQLTHAEQQHNHK